MAGFQGGSRIMAESVTLVRIPRVSRFNQIVPQFLGWVFPDEPFLILTGVWVMAVNLSLGLLSYSVIRRCPGVRSSRLLLHSRHVKLNISLLHIVPERLSGSDNCLQSWNICRLLQQQYFATTRALLHVLRIRMNTCTWNTSTFKHISFRTVWTSKLSTSFIFPIPPIPLTYLLSCSPVYYMAGGSNFCNLTVVKRRCWSLILCYTHAG